MTKEQARAKAKKYREWAKKAQEKHDRLYAEWEQFISGFDWTEPIKQGHHSQRRHERMYEKRQKKMSDILELDRRIKSHTMKAENLEAFANRNRGDARKRREWERAENDKKIRKGTRIYDPALRSGTVEKVNKNTYTIMFDSGYRTTRDKSFVEVL